MYELDTLTKFISYYICFDSHIMTFFGTLFRKYIRVLLLAFLLIPVPFASIFAQSFLGVRPLPYANATVSNTALAVIIDNPIINQSVTIFGSYSGKKNIQLPLSISDGFIEGSQQLSARLQNVQFNYRPGEIVDVCVRINAVSFSYRFRIENRGLPTSFNAKVLNQLSAIPVGNNVAAVAGDFNNDGSLDLLAIDNTTTSLLVLRGDGMGGFISDASITLLGSLKKIVTGDIDNDGKLDFVVSTVNGLMPYLNLSSVGGSIGFNSTSGLGVDVDDVQLSDANGDGQLDLLFYGTVFNPPVLQYLQGNGTGYYGTSINVKSPISTRDMRVIAFADLNKDGYGDIICGSYASNARALLLHMLLHFLWLILIVILT